MIEYRVDWPVGDYRTMVRALDECLAELENARERGETFVSDALVSRLRTRMPWVTARMRIADAMERVFDEPAAAGPAPRPPATAARRPTVPLDRLEARQLTDRIKTAARQTCLLLREAHDRRAWVSLRYRTWEQYVRAEFGLSRRRSYDLLDQARVISAVQEAARTSAPPRVSAHAAVRVKARLAMVTSVIRGRTAGLSEAEAHVVVEEVIRHACATDSRARASVEAACEALMPCADLRTWRIPGARSA